MPSKDNLSPNQFALPKKSRRPGQGRPTTGTRECYECGADAYSYHAPGCSRTA